MPLAPQPRVRSLPWVEVGSGPPLLLLPGLGAGAASWGPVLDRLAARYRCIAVESHDTGDAVDRVVAMADLAAGACTVLDRLGVRAAHVLGNSLGGMVAQAMAIAHPERVRSLVLAATGPGVIAVPSHPAVPWHLAAGMRGRGERRLRHFASVFHGPATVVDHPERLRASLGGEPIPSGPAARRQLAAALRWTSLSRLHRVVAPTLVVHGTHDRLSPALNARLLARLIPGARLHLLDRCGHFIITDAGDELCVVIDRFLRSEPVTTAASRRWAATLGLQELPAAV